METNQIEHKTIGSDPMDKCSHIVYQNWLDRLLICICFAWQQYWWARKNSSEFKIGTEVVHINRPSSAPSGIVTAWRTPGEVWVKWRGTDYYYESNFPAFCRTLGEPVSTGYLKRIL